jgi:hypothetical protein
MKLFAAILALSLSTASHAQEAGIWSYAFVSRTTEPVAGHGAAIFMQSGSEITGPLQSQERLPYKLSFSLSANRATGTLTSEKGRNTTHSLTGTVTRTNTTAGCLTSALLQNGFHFVLIEREGHGRCET